MLTAENKQRRFYSCDPKLHTITINPILSNENGGELSVIFQLVFLWCEQELHYYN